MKMSQSMNLLYDRISREVERNLLGLDVARRKFQLSQGGNAYPERVLSYFFIRAIADAKGGADVFLEVPVLNTKSGRRDNHLDALVFNNEVAILAEFKRGWTPRLWQDLAADVKRVRDVVGGDVLKRFRDKKPRRLHGFYGIDAWRAPIADAWLSGTEYRRWVLPDVFSKMDRRMHFVWENPDKSKVKDDHPYYALWALEPLNVAE
jgi:hypothetical protein